MFSNMSLMLCNPSAVCLILAAESSGDKSGSKKRSFKNERVPQLSASASGEVPFICPIANEVAKNVVTIFRRLVTFSWGEIDALIIGIECLNR